ncbi:MAG: hypothetical protein L6Q80_08025 [Dehalococcoidia bacterium]|nr:hypothetical protein [Dehalococcoidia bacterium]
MSHVYGTGGAGSGDWSRAWGGAEQVVHAVFEGIKGSVRNAVAFVEGLAPLMLAAARALAQALLDGLRSVLSHAAGFAGDVAQAVLQAVKAVVNGVIDQLNRAVEFTIPGPGPLPGIHVDPPDIPHLARGGIVVAGDNPSGIEAVVPLERAGEFGFGGRERAAEVHNHFHFSGFVGDVDELLRQLQLAAGRAGRSGVLA